MDQRNGHGYREHVIMLECVMSSVWACLGSLPRFSHRSVVPLHMWQVDRERRGLIHGEKRGQRARRGRLRSPPLLMPHRFYGRLYCMQRPSQKGRRGLVITVPFCVHRSSCDEQRGLVSTCQL
ncbi:hypothetical protein SKAU_G00074600 [Synaphobranchus kaupii]|uniref:Uncharacterized protein n=1 Tax=Synaphobranchus kaupii TaxID=118154 RepID=A0A9Q1G914_SYNKA|nr:hypothetical protein SKAU_G00074600 [Synaphobranchus kaupii]